MNTEEIYTDIERFLNGELSETELAQFHERMADDPAFAEEVALHRKLHHAMEDPIKMALRSSLDGLRHEFSDTPPAPEAEPALPKNNYRLIWSAVACILVVGFALWFFLRTPPVDDNTIQEDNSTKQEQTTPEVQQPVSVPDNVIPTAEKTEDNNTKEVPEIIEQAPNPIAIDYYKQNSEIETYLKNIDLQATHQFTFQAPQTAEVIPPIEGQIDLLFQGQLKSYNYSDSDVFTLSIFNNQTSTFRNNKPLFETKLALVKKEDNGEGDYAFGGDVDEFNFKFFKALPLQMGRYYYVVRKSSSTDVLAGGSFEVK